MKGGEQKDDDEEEEDEENDEEEKGDDGKEGGGRWTGEDTEIWLKGGGKWREGRTDADEWKTCLSEAKRTNYVGVEKRKIYQVWVLPEIERG